jgi:hypothetical protein
MRLINITGQCFSQTQAIMPTNIFRLLEDSLHLSLHLRGRVALLQTLRLYWIFKQFAVQTRSLKNNQVNQKNTYIFFFILWMKIKCLDVTWIFATRIQSCHQKKKNYREKCPGNYYLNSSYYVQASSFMICTRTTKYHRMSRKGFPLRCRNTNGKFRGNELK